MVRRRVRSGGGTKFAGNAAASQVVQYQTPTPDEVHRVMSALGRKGGKKGGKARAAKLSSKERSDIAQRAAIARWSAVDDN